MTLELKDAIIASALKNIKHIAMMDILAANAYDRIDFSTLMVHLYETVDESLLDTLADEMDMLGYNGWALATMVRQKRDLLINAVDIKRLMGTPAAIIRAARVLGILGPIYIEEGIGFQYNGTVLYNHTIQYGAANWARFIVKFDASLNPTLDEARLEDFRRMIEVYKPARSQLYAILAQ